MKYARMVRALQQGVVHLTQIVLVVRVATVNVVVRGRVAVVMFVQLQHAPVWMMEIPVLPILVILLIPAILSQFIPLSTQQAALGGHARMAFA
jgi:hypothetical protein